MYPVIAKADVEIYKHQDLNNDQLTFDECATDQLEKLNLKQELEIKNNTNLFLIANAIYEIDCKAPNNTIKVDVNLMMSNKRQFYHDKR